MTCEKCYFWSEMVAQSIGCGPVEAMCLNDNSDYYQEMTAWKSRCDDFEDGNGTTIDSPY